MNTQHDLTFWLKHFENLHPVGIDMGLSRVAAVWKKLCKQYNIKSIAKEKIITVSGTNGKGSSCQMLTQLLTAQGYTVGTYTSPHIHTFNERIQIDGNLIDDVSLIQAFEVIENVRGEISISYFEASTLAALLIFAWKEIDFAILEVGLGGRLDAVNIIDADAILITSIGRDHENYLGSDIANITREKAGVCRPHCPTVFAQALNDNNETHNVIQQALTDYTTINEIPLLINGHNYRIKDNQIILQTIDTVFDIPDNIIALGIHQINNYAGVIVLLSKLQLLPENYHKILQQFSLAGRLQRINKKPTVIIDVAHNEDSAHALAGYVENHRDHYNNIYVVIGMLKDKDHKASLLPFADIPSAVFCGSTENIRGFSDIQLTEIAKSILSCPVIACGTLKNALSQAQQQASENDLIIAFGSFLVAEELTTN